MTLDYTEVLPRLDSLSPREREVLAMLGLGMQSKTIAHRLFLKCQTVDNYRQTIRRKLRLEHGSELIAFAVECRIRDQPTIPHS